jgi:hypothetical protein
LGTSVVPPRPNILINPLDERELFIVRDGDKLDKLDGYNLVVPSPRITAGEFPRGHEGVTCGV